MKEAGRAVSSLRARMHVCVLSIGSTGTVDINERGNIPGRCAAQDKTILPDKRNPEKETPLMSVCEARSFVQVDGCEAVGRWAYTTVQYTSPGVEWMQ